jgi:prolyl-tRNA synthetase
LGPRDIEANTTLAVRRYDSKKWSIPLDDISTAIRRTLDEIQVEMYTRAKNIQDERLKKVTNWDDVVPTLDAKNILVLPWCEQESCEDDIKERSKSQYVPFLHSSMFLFCQWKILINRANKGEAEDVKAPSAGAKSLCIPHDQARFGEFPEGENQKCVQCGEKAKRWTLFGRSKFFFITLWGSADG